MKNFFIRRDQDLSHRMQMLRCYVFPIIQYGCESWILKISLENSIEAFEMFVYRRILRIFWFEKIRNAEVLSRMQINNELMLTIKKRKLKYYGYIITETNNVTNLCVMSLKK